MTAGQLAHRVRAWPARRVALGGVAGLLLVSAAVLGGQGPVGAQEGEAAGEPKNVAEVRISGLSRSLTYGGRDSFTVTASNLTTVVGYDVIVSRNNGTLGIGACGTGSQTQRVSGVTSQNLSFTVRACAAGSGTVTAVVRRTGLTTNEDAASQTVTVQARAPHAPARPTAPNPQARAFTAQWQAPGDTGGTALTGYHVIMRPNGAAWPPDREAKKVGATTRRQRFSKLTPNRIYWFKVKACNGANQTRCSGWSPQASVTLPIGTPGTPTWGSFTAEATQIRVTWSAPGDTGGVGLTGYGLRRWRPGTDREPSSAQVTVNAQTSARTFTGLAPNTGYRFSIQACNGTNRCSGWTNKDATTQRTPEPTPTPTPEPTPTPTPAPAPRAPSFGSTGSLTSILLVGQRESATLPAASGGTGTLTYQLAPVVGNGLSFDGTTRILSGTPQMATNRTTYTYTVTDAANRSAQIPLHLTVFDVRVRVAQDYEFKPLAKSTWRVFDIALVAMREAGFSRSDGHQVRLRLPASTGFEFGRTCQTHAAPTATTVLASPWVKPNRGFDLVRCGLGSGAPISFEVQVRRGDDPMGDSLYTAVTTIPRSWHRHDTRVLYFIEGTLANGDIDGDQLFPVNASMTPHSTLTDALNYHTAAEAWQNVPNGGVTLARVRTNPDAIADVVISGYWDPGFDKEDQCEGSVACVHPAGTYPHLGNGQVFVIEDPPRWPEDDAGSMREWTTSLTDAQDMRDKFEHLPRILMHEFGHTLGLGHSTDGTAIMGHAARVDLATTDAEGLKATYAHHRDDH